MATLSLFPPVAVKVAAGKLLTISNSLTLAGTDSTTMTFPTTSATIARTDAANTFTGVQTFSAAPALSTNTVTTTNPYTITFPNAVNTTLAGLAVTETFTAPQTFQNGTTINDTGLTGSANALTLNTTVITTGNVLGSSSSAITSGQILSLSQNTSTFTGYGIVLNFGTGGGTFSGDFIYCANAGAVKFLVASDGTLSTAGSVRINSTGVFDVQSNYATPGTISGLAVIGRVPSGQTTLAQTIWMLFNQGGTTYRVPAWTNS